jgi:hypothetical protein
MNRAAAHHAVEAGERQAGFSGLLGEHEVIIEQVEQAAGVLNPPGEVAA